MVFCDRSMLQLDTIVAIATPPGIGSIGVIRVSGDKASSIVQTLCPAVSITRPRYVYFCNIVNPLTTTQVDEACVIFFQGPQSYTGEDCAELQVHGSYFVLQKVVELIIHLGARLAMPGEFTKRAFLNGKLDLTKAESVIDLIHSTTEKSHAVALSHVQGKLCHHIQECRRQLVRIYEQIEGSIDFPDEVSPVDHDQVISDLTDQQFLLQKIIDTQDLGEHVRHGVKCTIVGTPNVGKSSLFNSLVGLDRAIVSDIPGTTRDYLESTFILGGLLFHLYDTAGMRTDAEYIEHLGIRKIQALLKDADIIFWVVDQSVSLSEEDVQVFHEIEAFENVIVLQNKSDLESQFQWKSLAIPVAWETVLVSAKTGEGIESLKQWLYTRFVSEIERSDLSLLCNARQITCIKQAVDATTQMITSMCDGMEDDIISVDLKKAILKLGEVTGEEFTEEALDGIFSRFCVGK